MAASEGQPREKLVKLSEENQNVTEETRNSHSCCEKLFDPDLTIENVRAIQNKFCREREWEQYHTPRNLLIAMVGEVGELSELFQWRGEVPVGLPDWPTADKEHLEQELADVFIYLVRLAERCNVNLPKAVLDKFKHNEKKYPAEKVRGSSKKYCDYQEGTKLAVPDI